MKLFTDAEKLEVIEHLIAAIRQRRLADLDRGGSLQVDVLRTLAADIRAHMPGATEPTLVALENRVQKVRQSSHTRTSQGEHLFYDRDALAAAGTDLVARWPEIRAGLIELAMGSRR